MKSSRAEIRSTVHKIPRLRFESGQRLTSYAGLVVFQHLFRVLDFRNRLRSCFEHMATETHAVFPTASIVLLLVVHLILGFRRLRGLDFYRHDPLVARVVGLRRLPDVSTVSRALSAVDERGVQKVRALNRQLVLDRLRSERFARLTMDFDGSVQSSKGHAEGTAVGFNKVKKGARSYYLLLCTVAQTSQLFDMHHRPGNVHDSNGAADFMRRCFDEVGVLNTKLEARMDSAFYDQHLLAQLDGRGVEFSCSVPFLRFPELKRIVENQSVWQVMDREWSFFALKWKPKSWNRRYRLLCLRRRVRRQQKGPLQLDLFEPRSFEYEYKVIVTNKTGTAKSVLAFHNGRGTQEKIFGEAKQHSGLDLVATRTLHGNQIFTMASLLSHNLGRELQMQAVPRQRGTLSKRPASWRFDQLGTIRQRILHLAGRLSRPQGELTMSVSDNPAVRKELEKYLPQSRIAA